MARILIVEDDDDVRAITKTLLEGQKHTVDDLSDGSEASSWLKAYTFDLVVLDWNLPGMDGIQLCKQLRETQKQTMVLMLTGNAEINHKEIGFEYGADDYITKPFHYKEFLFRVQALLRRIPEVRAKPFGRSGLVLDPEAAVVTKGDGDKIQLTRREFQLLEFLANRPGQFFDSETLLNRIWESDSEATVEALRTCVKRLRKKIDDPNRPSMINSIKRLGYRFEPGEE